MADLFSCANLMCALRIATLANRQPRRTFTVTAQVASIGHSSAFAETDAHGLQLNASEHVRQQLGLGRIQTTHIAQSLAVRSFISTPLAMFAPSLTRAAQQPSRAAFVAEFFPEFAPLWLTTSAPTSTRTITTRRKPRQLIQSSITLIIVITCNKSITSNYNNYVAHQKYEYICNEYCTSTVHITPVKKN